MKKTILFSALAAVAMVSCNNLKENEYEITGEVDKSLNGKKVILQKMGGMFGFVPVDTVVVKEGEFVFKDTITKGPDMYFITIDGVQNTLNFIIEPGSIELEIDKDTIQKSVTGGTYNNEKLEEFKQLSLTSFKVREKFIKANREKFMAAQGKGDTVTTNKLNKDLEKIAKDQEKQYIEFVKNNPKAYYNLYVLNEINNLHFKKIEEIKKLFDGLDASVKNTPRGKQISQYFVDYEKQSKTPPAPAPAEPATEAVKVGDAAPQFSAPAPDGKAVSLKQSMGKVTIVDFWAKWCGPCRAENPNMVALYKEFHAKGLNIVGVSLDDNAADWKKAIADDKLTWTHVSNLKKWDEPIALQYGVKSIPATFVLDASGKVVASNLRGAELKAKVAELLK
jgi:peroxiredoxin